MLVVLELLDQPLDFVLATAERSTPDILKSTVLLQISPKLFESLDGSQDDLGFVDLVYHFANSILARLVALSELSEPSGGAHPEFSYIPLCKQQAVCRERLRVTMSGKSASLSLERASNLHQNTVF